MGNSALVGCRQQQQLGEDGTPLVRGVPRDGVLTFGLNATCCSAKNRRSISDLEGLDDAFPPTVPMVPALPEKAEPPPAEADADDEGGPRERIDEEEWRSMLDVMKNYSGVLDDSQRKGAADGALRPGGEESDEGSASEAEAEAEGAKVEKGRPEMKGKQEEEDPQTAFERELKDALKAVSDGKPLYTIPKHLRGDKELVLTAIGNEGAYCFDYISSQELKTCDRDVVLALVFSDGTLLENASEELRKDREIVRAALSTYADALKFASKELQADKDIRAMATSRAKEESRLMKMLAAKCGPAVQGCMGR